MSRLILAALILAAIAAPSRADEAAPARFFIEKIEVRNAHRASPDLIKAETLLHEGAEYSEADLKAASARLTRLPFLLSADFALTKGSDRGRVVLVITVVETKPFFFLLDARPTLWDDSRRTVDYEVDPISDSADAALGFRTFVGGRGIVHIGVTARRDRHAFTTDYSSWAVGYTRYDLFGTRAFATINLRLPFDSPAGGSISPQIVAGIPLTANQTLTVDYEDTHFRDDTITILDTDFHRQDSERLMSLAWTFNTTNEPFVPTRGSIYRVAALRSMRDRAGFHFTRAVPDPAPEQYAQHINGNAIDLTAMRYWELNERDSVSAGLLGGWATVEDTLDPPGFRPPVVAWKPTYATVRGGYSRSLWKGDAKNGDSRIEVDARFVARQRNVSRGRVAFGSTPDDESVFQTSASWVRRSAWGTLRLGAGYSWGH